MDHTPTYEETSNDYSIYVVARCSCGWEWRDSGIIGYNEGDVRSGAKAHHSEHLRLLGVEFPMKSPPLVLDRDQMIGWLRSIANDLENGGAYTEGQVQFTLLRQDKVRCTIEIVGEPLKSNA